MNLSLNDKQPAQFWRSHLATFHFTVCPSILTIQILYPYGPSHRRSGDIKKFILLRLQSLLDEIFSSFLIPYRSHNYFFYFC